MKKIFAVSIIAITAVTSARADIASKAYVDVADNGNFVLTANTAGENIAALDAALDFGTDTTSTTVAQAIAAAINEAGGQTSQDVADAIGAAIGDLDAATPVAGGTANNVVTGVAEADGVITVTKGDAVDAVTTTPGGGGNVITAISVNSDGHTLDYTRGVTALQASDITTGDSTSGNGTIKVSGSPVAVYGLGNAAYQNVTSTYTASDTTAPVSGAAVASAISDLNSGGTYEVTANKSDAASATTDLADNAKKDVNYPTLAGAKAIADAEITALDLGNTYATKSEVGDTSGLATTYGTGNDTVVEALGVVKTTADAAIPAPQTACANATNKCVLTYDNSGYAWEVIARADNGN